MVYNSRPFIFLVHVNQVGLGTTAERKSCAEHDMFVFVDVYRSYRCRSYRIVVFFSILPSVGAKSEQACDFRDV